MILIHDYKFYLGIASVSIVLANHFYYFCLTYKRLIRPHAFTLLVYFIVTISVAAGMWGEGDKWAAFRLAIPTPAYLFMLFLTMRRGVEYIRPIDIVMLSLSLLGLPVWWLTQSPRAAILFLAAIEGCGMVPGIRKAYVLPFEESMSSPLISASAMLLAVLAVRDPVKAWATTLYLAYWAAICLFLAGMIFIRRYMSKRSTTENTPVY